MPFVLFVKVISYTRNGPWNPLATGAPGKVFQEVTPVWPPVALVMADQALQYRSAVQEIRFSVRTMA